jgi:2,3-diaminopropionate biosynthesis protein SbnB
MLVLTNADVRAALAGREVEVMEAVGAAYVAHEAGATVVPHSSLLRFPDRAADRIIALPAFVGGPRPLAGIKWIASFPSNVSAGRERASAAILLNSMDTGEPVALVEASVISARRTAASAALASQLLSGGCQPESAALIGCGVINTEILRFLRTVHPALSTVGVYDLDPVRAYRFAEQAERRHDGLRAVVAECLAEAVSDRRLVSIATTATTPYLDTAVFDPGTLVLHVSLRDILPCCVLDSVNVVDDPEHACRADTSLDLAQRLSGDRLFIHATIGALAQGATRLSRDPQRTTLFSPFGLGVLDLAVADLVHRWALESGRGLTISDFLPAGPGAAG